MIALARNPAHISAVPNGTRFRSRRQLPKEPLFSVLSWQLQRNPRVLLLPGPATHTNGTGSVTGGRLLAGTRFRFGQVLLEFSWFCSWMVAPSGTSLCSVLDDSSQGNCSVPWGGSSQRNRFRSRMVALVKPGSCSPQLAASPGTVCLPEAPPGNPFRSGRVQWNLFRSRMAYSQRNPVLFRGGGSQRNLRFLFPGWQPLNGTQSRSRMTASHGTLFCSRRHPSQWN